MKAKLAIEISFDKGRTDAEALACAFDTLLETAMSIPDILEEYGPVAVGPFVVHSSKSEGLDRKQAWPDFIVAVSNHSGTEIPVRTAADGDGESPGVKRENLSERELATVLAALRLWQRSIADTDAHASILAFQEHFLEGIAPLSSDEIDDLCERLNCE